jgi:hypothetical protein
MEIEPPLSIQLLQVLLTIDSNPVGLAGVAFTVKVTLLL